jgi:hypothetical protein
MFCTHSHQTTIARSNGGIFAIRADGCATGIEQRSRFNHVDRGSDRSDFELHIDHGLLADCKGQALNLVPPEATALHEQVERARP